jgi:hypothetical protein
MSIELLDGFGPMLLALLAILVLIVLSWWFLRHAHKVFDEMSVRL